MRSKEQLRQDLIRIVDLTERDHRYGDAEWEYALQMNIDHYFDRRMPPYNGDIFKDIKCLWESKGGKDVSTEEDKKTKEV